MHGPAIREVLIHNSPPFNVSNITTLRKNKLTRQSLGFAALAVRLDKAVMK